MRGRLLKLSCLVAVAALEFSGRAQAAPLPPGMEDGCAFVGCVIAYWSEDDGGTGNYYAYVPTSTTLTWSEAWALAAASSLGPGSAGHLVTIAEAVENDFVVSVLPGAGVIAHKQQVWIGGYQVDGPIKTLPPDQGWSWVTPETWDYTNWLPGEPNDENTNHDGDERYLAMWVHYYRNGVDMRGTWNDENDLAGATSPLLGMIVEYEQGTPVPEPAAIALFGVAAGLLALARRARRG